jgi:hypothetical protein
MILSRRVHSRPQSGSWETRPAFLVSHLVDRSRNGSWRGAVGTTTAGSRLHLEASGGGDHFVLEVGHVLQ